MDPQLCRRVCPGRVVNIQRSNGVVHKATVKAVNVQQCSVSVEWCEAGVVKGKEIEIDDVVAINPELSEELPTTEVKENLPLLENVTVQAPVQLLPSTCDHPSLQESSNVLSTSISAPIPAPKPMVISLLEEGEEPWIPDVGSPEDVTGDFSPDDLQKTSCEKAKQSNATNIRMEKEIKTQICTRFKISSLWTFEVNGLKSEYVMVYLLGYQYNNSIELNKEPRGTEDCFCYNMVMKPVPFGLLTNDVSEDEKNST
ncbi:UNVERIFIED_CONTAM: hypothetical protein H355_013785 [Colinus virginianus]|nr:hypothetical protein H355_013785 [Colinus virginianus]